MFAKPVKSTYEAVFSLSSAGTSPWKPFGPCRGRGMAVIASFVGTSNGVSVKVQGSLTSGSTSDGFLIAQRKSSAGQNNVQTLSTSGAATKFLSFLRIVSSGTLTAAKTCRVRIVALGVSS